MGSFSRVKIIYANPITYLSETKGRHIFGLAMEGKPIAALTFRHNDIFVVGSESHGISPEINTLIETHLHIPNYANTPNKAESLNASIAAAILMYDFCRAR
jgi:TrmH family RNA methyltransferase